MSGLASDGARGAPPSARWPALLACTAAIAVVALAAAAGADGLQAEAAGAPVLAAEPAQAADAPLDSSYAGRTSADVHVIYDGYAPLVHPSTLELSGYPAPGSGEAANLTFAVTYMGGWGDDGGAAVPWRPAGDHPPVRLDVTGSEYPDLYRITDVVSNIGTAGPGVFEPYDHETEDTVAEPGRTYTVRAQIEFVVEGFVPVYALGLDGDVVTVDVAASQGLSMPYPEYVATGEDYLDHTLAEPGPLAAREMLPGSIAVAAPAGSYGGPLKGAPPPAVPGGGLFAPLSESSVHSAFNATGNVTTAGFAGRGEAVPVHGIQVCAVDLSRNLLGEEFATILNTTAGEPACAYTDAGGRYDILGVSGADPHGTGRADVIIVVVSRGHGGLVDLVTYEHGKHRLYGHADDAGLSPDYAGTLHAYNVNITGGGMAGAARIISTLSDGMAFFERLGHEPAPLLAKWHSASGARIFPDKPTDGAAYLPGSAKMWLDGPSRTTGDDSFDRRVILHELAHHVHAIHDSGLEYHCPVHYYTYKYDERCAWGEGWAQVVPHLVYDSALLSSGPVPAWWYDIEAGSLWHGGPPGTAGNSPIRDSRTFEGPDERPIGDHVEGSVAAAMWDMADNASGSSRDTRTVQGGIQGRDDVAAGADAVVGVFLNGTYQTFAEYYDRWEIDMRHQSAERVAILHGMSFAVPSTAAHYGFAGELGGVFKRGLSSLPIQPNYVDVSGDGSTVAVTSSYGRGLQLINATDGGENMGLHAARGYEHACTLEYDTRACILDDVARASADLGAGMFSSMDGVAFGRNSSVILVSDGLQDRVHALGSDGVILGRFGSPGGGNGEFSRPDGIAFLPDGTTAAVADAGNRRIQTFEIASDGGAQYVGQFESYEERVPPTFTTQQLAAGPDGALYAADFDLPIFWKFPHGGGGTVVRIDDNLPPRPNFGSLGGIAVGPDGLVYASNQNGYVRVYNLTNANTAETSPASLGGRSLSVYSVRANPGLVVDEFGSPGRHEWQLGLPFGVALGPPAAGTGDVRVYVADHNGVKMYEKDRAAPRVVSVWAHTPDGNMTAGRTVEIAVSFSERVTVTGTPVLGLDAGAPSANATYASGSGSRILTFEYVVPSGGVVPQYLDYSGADSLALSAGAGLAPQAVIMDGSGNPANLTLPARGTAGSLAANAALWVDPRNETAPPLAIGRGPPAPVAAVEGAPVGFAVNATGPAAAGAASYSLVGAPAGAAINSSGAFAWTPTEAQDGLHEFAVNLTASGNSTVRTFRVLVAEDNEAPVIEPVENVTAYELSEIRFDVRATDADLPAQRLLYALSGPVPWGSAVLPNGTFVWTPSIYDGGETYAFNVTVSDGFGGSYGGDLAGKSFALFNVTVRDAPREAPPPITVVRVYSESSGAHYEGAAVPIAVEFSAPVDVTDDSLRLELDVGSGAVAEAVYSRLANETVHFEYTVGDGHHSHDLEYTGTDALRMGRNSTLAASGEGVVVLDLPEPGAPGSLSHTSAVSIPREQPLRIGVIGDAVKGGMAEAARLAADDFGPAGEPPGIIVVEYAAGSNASAIGDALRAAHANGTGPDFYVGPLGDEALHAALPYANASGIVLVSTSSSAPSLAAEGDAVIRLSPGDAMREVALAWLVAESAPSSIHVVIDEGYYGPANRTAGAPPPQDPLVRGAGGALAGLLSPQTTVGLSGPGAQWADEAERIASAINSSGGGPAAVVFFGPDSSLVEFAMHADSRGELRSARWFAAGPADPPGYLGAVPSESLPAALSGLTAVSWAVPENSVTARIDASLLAADVSAGLASYAAYDAVRLLGWAEGAADADDSPPEIAARIVSDGQSLPPAALGGALGNVSLDGAGDLDRPDEYRVWRIENGTGGLEWRAQNGTDAAGQGGQPRLVRGTPTCEARLAPGSLDFNVIPGRHSAPSGQTIVNSGLFPLERVEASASPWIVDPGAGAAGTLPASLAEVSRSGPHAGYAPMSEGTIVAEGVGFGANASAWHRINLSGHGDLQGGVITQNVTYTLSCRTAGQ